MTIHKALYPRNVYVSRKEGRRGLSSIYNIDTSIRWLENSIKKEQRKANYSDQKQHKQHNNQQNNNGGVMVIVVGNGHDDTSSNPGRNWLHFT